MKTQLFTLLLLCLGYGLTAQVLQQSPATFDQPEPVKYYRQFLDRHPDMKTQAQASRVLAYCSFDWISNAWVYRDTSFYSYSGTRGGDVQTQAEPLFDTRLTKQWDGTAWQDRYLYEKTYNAADQVLESIRKEWDGIIGWYIKNRSTYVYNVDGDIMSATHELGNGTNIVFDYRYLYTYNTDGLQDSYQKDIWNGLQWEGDYRSEFTFTTSGQKLTELRQVYSGTWDNQYLVTNTYDAQDNLTSVTRQNWSGGSWQYINRSTYTYDAQNNQLTYLYQIYNAGVWEDSNRETYTYDSHGNRLTSFSEAYVAGTWQSQYRSDHTYDAQDRVTDDAYYEWLGGAWQKTQRYSYVYNQEGYLFRLSYYEDNMGAWEEKSNVEYTYNSFGQFVTGKGNTLSGVTMVNRDSVIYHYELYDDGTGIEQLTELDSKVMPNPFKTNVALQVGITATGTYTFEVYNLAGQKLYEEQRYWPAGQQTLVWEGQDANGNVIPQGIYFFTISSGRHMASGKLIKQ